MSDKPSNEGLLADHHNVARHCGARVISEYSGLPTAAAFKIRSNEEYLSVNWLEYFHKGDFDIALIGVRCALIGKGRTIGAKSRFAILNVGNVRNTILQKLKYVPQIIRKAEEFDKPHAGIYVPQKKRH